MIPATQVKPGMCIVIDGEPHIVLERRHITLGRGTGKITLKVRNLKTGDAFEKRFFSDEKVEIATLEEVEMEFLYNDNEFYYFMNIENYEQISLPVEAVGENKYYLTPNVRVYVQFFEGKPIGIKPPKEVILEVIDTEPTIKHATASAQYKPAILETGLKIQVPPHVNKGDKVKIKTETGEYIEKV